MGVDALQARAYLPWKHPQCFRRDSGSEKLCVWGIDIKRVIFSFERVSNFCMCVAQLGTLSRDVEDISSKVDRGAEFDAGELDFGCTCGAAIAAAEFQITLLEIGTPRLLRHHSSIMISLKVFHCMRHRSVHVHVVALEGCALSALLSTKLGRASCVLCLSSLAYILLDFIWRRRGTRVRGLRNLKRLRHSFFGLQIAREHREGRTDRPAGSVEH